METNQSSPQANGPAGIESGQVAPNSGSGHIRGIAELFSASWQIYRDNFAKLIGISLLPVLAMFVLILISALLAGGAFLTTGLFKQDSMSWGAMAVAGIPMLIVGLLALLALIAFYLIAQAGLMLMVTEEGRDLTIKQALVAGKKRAVGLLWVGFLTGLLVLIGFLLLIIPGIILFVFFSMSSWVFLCEGVRGYGALRRSKEMVSGNWGTVAVRFLVPILAVMLISAVLSSGGNQQAEPILGFLNQIVSLIISPFLVIYSYLIYRDLVAIKPATANNQ